MEPTPINILIDGESLIEYFDHVSIKFSEGAFCNSIDINIADQNLWEKFDPIKYFGLLKLQVIIGEKNYEFLIEERNSTVNQPGVVFSSWGRTAQALLDAPYSKLINDEEEKVHPWQLDNTTPQEIITHVMNYCCSDYIRSKVWVNWNVENFTIYKDSFSVSHETPISIISKLVGIIGAEFVANADGSLTVQEYSVSEGIAIQEYNDLDHIVSLSDDIVYPIGYNSVLVNGYGTSPNTDEKSKTLTAVLREDSLKGWEYGKRRIVRCYYYTPEKLSINTDCLNGISSYISNGVEQITEEVFLEWGKGSTTYTSITGNTEVTGDENIVIAIREVSYPVYYFDFSVISLIMSEDVEGIAAFFFSDHSNMQTISFDYYDTNTNTDTDTDTKDYGLLLELNETEEDKNNFILKFKILGYPQGFSQIKRIFTSVYTSPSLGGSGTDSMEEVVTFTNGSGSVSKPISRGFNYRWLTPGKCGILYTAGNTDLKLNYTSDSYPIVMVKISYLSEFKTGIANIPESFSGIPFSVYLQKKNGEILSVSKTVSLNDITTNKTKDVTLTIKDFATEIVIPYAAISIDDVYRGSTNENGILTIQNLAVGNHTIRIVASGYLDSDEDELANDTFTVSED